MMISKGPNKLPKDKKVKRLTTRQRVLLRNTTEGHDQMSWNASVLTQGLVPPTAETYISDVFVTEEFDDSRLLGSVVAFMSSLAGAECPPVGVCIGDRGMLVLSPCGKKLQQLVRIPIDIILNKFHQHLCHPFVAAYLRALDAVSVFHIECCTGPRENVVAEFAQALQRLHAEVHTKEMRRLVHNFERGSRKCYRSTMDMVHGVISRHAKVLSIRLDLSYRSANPYLELAHFSDEEAQAHLAAFVHHMLR